MPPQSAVGALLALASAVGTGIAVAHAFRWPIQRARAAWSAALPLVVVPVAILVFAGLIWLSRQVSHTSFDPPLVDRSEFLLIASTYAVYGMLSLFAPVLWALAYINQHWLRSVWAKPGTA